MKSGHSNLSLSITTSKKRSYNTQSSTNGAYDLPPGSWRKSDFHPGPLELCEPATLRHCCTPEIPLCPRSQASFCPNSDISDKIPSEILIK